MKKLLATAVRTIFFFMGWVLLAGLIPVPDSGNAVIWRLWAELIPFLCIVGLSLIFWMIDRRKVRLCLISSPVRNSMIGVITGTVWIGAVTAFLMVCGVMSISGYNDIPMLWLWIIAAFLNTAMQELLFRGYLYQMLKTNYSVMAATAVSTILFTLMHAGAFEAGIIPVINVLTMSLLMTIVLEYTQSLLAPTVMHFIWNSVGAIILGGVSLADDYPHLLTATFNGNILLTGGSPKIEGSAAVLIVNLLLLIGFGILLKKKKQ